MMSFTHDGGFAGSATDADGLRYALLGTSITTLHARRFPQGAVVCGFEDQRRGIAAGRTAARLWRTLDGGEHWDRVDLGIDGVPSEVPLLPRPDAVYGAITCADWGCQIDRAASIRGWGTITEPGRHVLGPVPPPPAPEPPPMPPVEPTSSIAPSSAPPSSPEPESSPAPTHRSHRH
jgi:hypothetical protein